MSLRTPLGRVRGLGAGGEGVEHWWTQRLLGAALVPLTLWFAASVVAMTGADYEAMRAWIASPVVAGLLILLLVAVFTHGALSIQTVLEDYVHTEPVKFVAIIVVKAGAILLTLTGVLAVLTILFKG